MGELHLLPLLWLVALQMGLYALMWVACGLLLRESRASVARWGLFMLLLGVAFGLAALRGTPREWLHYNGASIVAVVAFAVMRRGTEKFMGLPRRDAEQLAVLTPVLVLIALAGPSEATAALRVVATYAAQVFVTLRTVALVRHALQVEFGQRAMLAVVVSGVGVALILGALSLHQLLVWPRTTESLAPGAGGLALMTAYLLAGALLGLGFLVMLTQRLVSRLRQASVRDPLTGLYNRRAIAETLERQWLRSRRSEQPLAVLVIDLDHFKHINDTLGHAAGDRVLMHLASLLQRHVRAEDVVGRVGSEEFLLVLPDTEAPQALALAERLRALVRAEALGTTISTGIAIAHAGDDAAESVVARANGALYRAKRAGRNRIEVDGAPGPDQAASGSPATRAPGPDQAASGSPATRAPGR